MSMIDTNTKPRRRGTLQLVRHTWKANLEVNVDATERGQLSRSKQIPVERNKRTWEESRKERCITSSTSIVIKIKNVFFVLKKVVIRDMQSARWYSLALASMFYKYIEIERAGHMNDVSPLYKFGSRIQYVVVVKNL
mmetsp:Transcript_22096/g.33451  ORF Transcript_22096/g.33451 Transcript_22096/m.33451 type:complete len:137 (-) Transcript_22096:1948-2358(-)